VLQGPGEGEPHVWPTDVLAPCMVGDDLEQVDEHGEGEGWQECAVATTGDRLAFTEEFEVVIEAFLVGLADQAAELEAATAKVVKALSARKPSKRKSKGGRGKAA